MNEDCQQLANHFERHVFKGPDAPALAASTTLCIWNMVCAAVEQQLKVLAEDKTVSTNEDSKCV